MSRNIFIAVLLLIGVATVAGEWYWQRRDFLICRASANLAIDRQLESNDAARLAGLLVEHFSREGDYRLSMSAQSRQGELSGIFRRKIQVPTELGRKLGGSDSDIETPIDKTAVEQAIRGDIESIPLTLKPGNFGIHLVIDDPQLTAQARQVLQAAVPNLVAERQLEGVAAVYSGTDPVRDARLIADVKIGAGQTVVLGNHWTGEKDLLAIFLVQDSPVVSASQLVSFEEMAEVDPLMGNSGPSFSLKLDDAGSALFATFTGSNIGRKAAIVINDFVHSAPQIQSAIEGGSLVLSLGRSNSRHPGLRMASSVMMGKAGLPDPGLTVKDIAINCY